MSVFINRRIDRWKDERRLIEERIFVSIYRWMEEWIDGWMDR